MFLLDQLHANRDKTESEEQKDGEQQLQQLAGREDEADVDQDNEEAVEQAEEQQEHEEEEEEEEEQEEDEEEKEEEDVGEEEQLGRADYDGSSHC